MLSKYPVTKLPDGAAVACSLWVAVHCTGILLLSWLPGPCDLEHSSSRQVQGLCCVAHVSLLTGLGVSCVCCVLCAVPPCSTITHQPPEVLLDGGAAFTPAADVYAWGVLLWVSAPALISIVCICAAPPAVLWQQRRSCCRHDGTACLLQHSWLM